MLRFARACESVAATPATSEKARLVAEYLPALDDADLEAAVRFFAGRALARGQGRTLSLGGAAIAAAAKHVWGPSDAQLSDAYREHGDLGAALSRFVRPPLDLGLFAQTLSPASLAAAFDEIAQAAGKGAAKRRLILCERIFGACKEPLEAKYAIKIMTGELRIGLREGLVVDAVAAAFDAQPAAIRRALMAGGEAGSVAVAARHHGLQGVQIAYGTPLGFMLASPMPFGGEYRELSASHWIVEDKFDGVRAQAHKYGDRIALFSRTLNDISNSYPETIAALAQVPGDFIVDGELVAQRDGSVLPFRYLQARLQRKLVTEELLEQVPVTYCCFDLLALGTTYLLDEPLAHRRERLERLVAGGAHLAVSAANRIESNGDPGIVQRRFEEARARGHEGLIFKREDSPYYPGRRGKWWLKLKRELSTLDVVVVAVEWGHGKRAKVLSDYTFAVRGDRGALVAIGKAYSGLTDAEIAELTPWFLEHRLPAAVRRTKGRSHEIPVDPQIVLEVAFDVVAESDLHESGFSLRFPRIVRIRNDKPPSEIDTLERVREIHREMLVREGLA